MNKTKCITFDKAAQGALPEHIKDKMKADRENAKVRQTVKNFIVKKFLEIGENIYGSYDNGSACAYPSIQVDICVGENDSYNVTYCCGAYMWDFNFTKNELQSQPPKREEGNNT